MADVDAYANSMENLNLTDSAEQMMSCSFVQPVYVEERFYLVAVFGTATAIVNILENSFLSVMLFKKKSYRSSHMLYLALLAFFDVWMAAAYIPLMSLNLATDYYESVVLLRAWFAYMLPMITISHIAMTASSFLMVAASLERYCVTAHPNHRRTKWLQKHRTAIAACSVLMGIICKFTHALEITVIYNRECYGTMKEYSIEASEMTRSPVYDYWRVIFRAVFTILIPFSLLALINIRIVTIINRSEFEYLQSTKLSDAKRKARVRNATRTLVFVVFTYLLSNVLNVVIILWEYVDYEQLSNDFNEFYTCAVDVVSLLTILTGTMRLPIYVSCQPDLRKEFVAQFKKFLSSATYYNGYGQTNTTTTGMDATEEDEKMDAEEDEEENPRQYPLLFTLGTVLLVESNTDKQSGTCRIIRNDVVADA